MRDYGLCLGMGFQIIDDVLDFRGDTSVLGKPVGSDLREGIITLPVLYYLRAHPEDQRVTAVVQDGQQELVQDIVAAVRGSWAIAEAMDRAERFITRSKEALAVLPGSEPRAMLHELADYAVSRQK